MPFTGHLFLFSTLLTSVRSLPIIFVLLLYYVSCISITATYYKAANNKYKYTTSCKYSDSDSASQLPIYPVQLKTDDELAHTKKNIRYDDVEKQYNKQGEYK